MVNEVTMTWVANYLKLEPYMIDRIHVEGLTALKGECVDMLWVPLGFRLDLTCQMWTRI